MNALHTLTSLAALMGAVSVTAPALAEGPVVVELFTSQGCSSCPPADAILGELATRDDVLALSLHVDYWDYIGWKDVFAHPGHSERQQYYAAQAGKRMIYTPQMIVNGTRDVVGNRAMDVADAIMQARSDTSPVEIAARHVGTDLTVELSAQGRAPVSDIYLVRFVSETSVAIDRGENAGHTITYHNVVTDWQTLDQWDGRGDLTLTADLSGQGGEWAVLVQAAPYGQMIAAAASK